MGQLVRALSEKPFRFLRKKHLISKETERKKLRMLRRFLEFCEEEGRRKFSQIQQKDWTNFCRYMRNQRISDETMRKYALVVREFARRAHIDLRVNPNNFRKRKNKQRQKTGRQASSASWSLFFPFFLFYFSFFSFFLGAHVYASLFFSFSGKTSQRSGFFTK